MSRKYGISALVLLLLISAALIVWFSFSPRQRDTIFLALSREMEGEPPPFFHVLSSDGEVSLFSDGRSGPYVVIFWSPGCLYCHRTMAFIAEWDERNGTSSQVVTVSFLNDFDINQKYLPEAASDWEQYALEPSDETRLLKDRDSMNIIPTLWAVDEDGIIVREIHGFNILAVNRILKRYNRILKPQLWFPLWMLNRPAQP